MNGQVRLRPPRHELDGRVVGYWRTTNLLAVAVPVVVLLVLGLLIPPARFGLLLPAVLLAVLGVPAAILLPRWWFRLHRWEVTETAVYHRGGWFAEESRIAPMSRLQTVDTTRGPLARRYGLATLVVTTASAKGPVKIEGLDHELAADLAHRLADVAEATPGDAT
jgi:membrane protein YdbS with pleckstrin-like domain